MLYRMRKIPASFHDVMCRPVALTSQPMAESTSVEENSGGRPIGEIDGERMVLAPKPCRILLVEDDFALRAALAELLTEEGYHPTCAANGAEALSRLSGEPLPAAILLDIILPRLSGIGFRIKQMQSPNLRTIPTIALSGMEDITELETLEFHAIFKKPFNNEALLHTLSDIRRRS